jgi:hypothetical protein
VSAELRVDFEIMHDVIRGENIHTPAMNRPKANPSSSRLQKLKEVSAGLHRLPGASNFERPSTKTTPIKRTVDAIPRSEAYERKDNGRKTVGVKLMGNLKRQRVKHGRTTDTYMTRPSSL